jgi:ABC-type uncharacterized transport system substrate-binding protein
MGVKVFLDKDPSYYYTIRYEDGQNVVYLGNPDKGGKKVETFNTRIDASNYCNKQLKQHFFNNSEKKKK